MSDNVYYDKQNAHSFHNNKLRYYNTVEILPAHAPNVHPIGNHTASLQAIHASNLGKRSIFCGLWVIENFSGIFFLDHAILVAVKHFGESNMTKEQKIWASQHDWFIRATDRGIVALDTCTSQHVEFTSFAKLRAWAGY